jgi:uncharacterized radical SAM superfamily protein
MTYTLKELGDKYESLWEQQDSGFNEISNLNKRQDNLEKYIYNEVDAKVSFAQLNYRDIIKQIYNIDKNIHQILDTIKIINGNQAKINAEIAKIKRSRNVYTIMFYLTFIILICFIYK